MTDAETMLLTMALNTKTTACIGILVLPRDGIAR